MTVRIAILTISDRVAAGVMDDTGGAAIREALQGEPWSVVDEKVTPDERDQIAHQFEEWADSGQIDLILSTGGTGLGPRDVTPEATSLVADRDVPGIAEALRSEGMKHTPHAMLSRGRAVTRGRTLIVNLPGSPRGALEGVEALRPVLEHAVAMMYGGRH